MDLKTRGGPVTDAERESIEAVLGPESDGSHDRRRGHAMRARRHLLLPTLHAVNDRVGWISPEAIDLIAERLDVSPAEIHGVVTFYGLFDTSPRLGRQMHVCVDLACRAAFDVDSLPDGCHPSPCLGRCGHAPAALVIEPGTPARRTSLGDLDRTTLASLAAGGPVVEAGVGPSITDVPQAGSEELVLLRRVGRGHPLDLDRYRADGGLRALARAEELGPEGVIGAIDDAGLLGRGGAAFPTGRKWRAVREQPGPRNLVCNADESEPGTFKDRVLLEHDPFAVLEAMCIAALATGCTHGWIYLRGEYPEAEAGLRAGVDEFRAAGLLGDDAGFDVTLFRGAGAYVCGEETALFNSIEGYRGEPRNKPPFPFESGLFGTPTVVNNVETLVNVLPIVLGEARADRRLFSLSGAVERPGVYEVELGCTLGDLIELAGGLPAGSELRAVLLGGAAGRFVGPDALDLVLDHDRVREAGLSLGSGVVMVHDQHVDLADQARRIAAFFRSESCGQCVPCRVGTVRQQEVIDRLASGRGPAAHRAEQYGLLADIAQVMGDASICGLGQTAGHAVESLVRLGAFDGPSRGER
jgi:NADH-quinone oxidoreductase subunit F